MESWKVFGFVAKDIPIAFSSTSSAVVTSCWLQKLFQKASWMEKRVSGKLICTIQTLYDNAWLGRFSRPWKSIRTVTVSDSRKSSSVPVFWLNLKRTEILWLPNTSFYSRQDAGPFLLVGCTTSAFVNILLSWLFKETVLLGFVFVIGNGGVSLGPLIATTIIMMPILHWYLMYDQLMYFRSVYQGQALAPDNKPRGCSPSKHWNQ